MKELTLLKTLQNEIHRVCEILAAYKDINADDTFAASVLKTEIHKADTAILEGDVPAMLNSLDILRNIEC
jgi:hypothetical protein